jgi:hypothetical protein
MILLKPTLEAYSNNPHRNGALPQTLYYLTLVSCYFFRILFCLCTSAKQLTSFHYQDAIDQQSDDWKEDHLAPGQLQDDPVAHEAYREAVGELLKHQRSNLRTMASWTYPHSPLK